MSYIACPECSVPMKNPSYCRCGYRAPQTPKGMPEPETVDRRCIHDMGTYGRCSHLGTVGHGSELRRCIAHDMLRYDPRRNNPQYVAELMEHAHIIMALQYPQHASDRQAKYGHLLDKEVPSDSPLRFLYDMANYKYEIVKTRRQKKKEKVMEENKNAPGYGAWEAQDATP